MSALVLWLKEVESYKTSTRRSHTDDFHIHFIARVSLFVGATRPTRGGAHRAVAGTTFDCGAVGGRGLVALGLLDGVLDERGVSVLLFEVVRRKLRQRCVTGDEGVSNSVVDGPTTNVGI